MKSQDTGIKRHDTRRRFEQWARNPECEANTVSAVHGIGMDKVAKSEGETPTMGQSPFALGRGQTFEKRLFENGGTLLGEALVKAGVLESPDFDFHDFRLRLNGGKHQNLDSALSATADYVKGLGEAPPQKARRRRGCHRCSPRWHHVARSVARARRA